MQIRICNQPMTFPDEVGELRDSGGLIGDGEALRARMHEDGYLLLRGFHPREAVLAARERIREDMRRAGMAEGRHQALGAIATTPEVLAVLESPALFELFARYFGEPARTFDEKWLRAVGPGGFTGVHYDSVYMGRGSDRLHTVWTPFGDTPLELGTLAICVGSHTADFAKLLETYGRMDVDRDRVQGSGWYTENPREVVERFGGRWCTAGFHAGDIILITMRTLHASTINATDQTRISCDTRFQPAADPADERWVGPARSGHTTWRDGTGPTMAEARARWGV